MKLLNMELLRSYDPCYDPSRYLPEDWTGTVIDILNHKEIPHFDKLWVVLRDDLVSERLMRLFAVWSARPVQHLMQDPRSLAVLDVVERFAKGEASEAERDAALISALTAADVAAHATDPVAWAAARAAALTAALIGARAAALTTAKAAVDAAAWDAASAAALIAAKIDAWDAAWAAAKDAASAAQRETLIEMIELENKEIDPNLSIGIE